MLGVGHGPLAFPPALAAARQDPQLADRVVQAYEAKQYAPGGTYVVIGAGIASVNEWANAIDAGARVISLLRNPKPDEQDLNTPRCLFEAFGIDIYQALTLEQRLTYLGKVLKGTAPSRRGWHERVERGRAEGRFAELQGEIDQVQAGPAGLRIHVSGRDGNDPGWLDVSGVVSATGFQKSALTVPLLRRLIEHYKLPVTDGRLALKRNCGVPGLDVPESRLGMMGIHANVVIPNGDTIAGLKYIARRFVVDCVEAEQLKRRPFLGRLRMQLDLASATADVIRKTRKAEQLA
jgi:hypothetical protein